MKTRKSKTTTPKSCVVKTRKLQPMNPTQARRAIEAAEWLYNNADAMTYTYEWREAQFKRIAEASKLWGEQQ